MQGTPAHQPGSLRALQGLQKSHQWSCLGTTGWKGRLGRRLHQFAAVHGGASTLLQHWPQRRAIAWGQQLGCGTLRLQRLPGRCQAWKDRRRGINELPPPLLGGRRTDVYEESDTPILTAPLELEVEPGEDIAAFSRRLGVPEAAVIEANGGSTDLQPGPLRFMVSVSPEELSSADADTEEEDLEEDVEEGMDPGEAVAQQIVQQAPVVPVELAGRSIGRGSVPGEVWRFCDALPAFTSESPASGNLIQAVLHRCHHARDYRARMWGLTRVSIFMAAVALSLHALTTWTGDRGRRRRAEQELKFGDPLFGQQPAGRGRPQERPAAGSKRPWEPPIVTQSFGSSDGPPPVIDVTYQTSEEFHAEQQRQQQQGASAAAAAPAAAAPAAAEAQAAPGATAAPASRSAQRGRATGSGTRAATGPAVRLQQAAAPLQGGLRDPAEQDHALRAAAQAYEEAEAAGTDRVPLKRLRRAAEGVRGLRSGLHLLELRQRQQALAAVGATLAQTAQALEGVPAEELGPLVPFWMQWRSVVTVSTLAGERIGVGTFDVFGDKLVVWESRRELKAFLKAFQATSLYGDGVTLHLSAAAPLLAALDSANSMHKHPFGLAVVPATAPQALLEVQTQDQWVQRIAATVQLAEPEQAAQIVARQARRLSKLSKTWDTLEKHTTPTAAELAAADQAAAEAAAAEELRSVIGDFKEAARQEEARPRHRSPLIPAADAAAQNRAGPSQNGARPSQNGAAPYQNGAGPEAEAPVMEPAAAEKVAAVLQDAASTLLAAEAAELQEESLEASSKAYEAASQQLPEGHPRRLQWEAAARGLGALAQRTFGRGHEHEIRLAAGGLLTAATWLLRSTGQDPLAGAGSEGQASTEPPAWLGWKAAHILTVSGGRHMVAPDEPWLDWLDVEFLPAFESDWEAAYQASIWMTAAPNEKVAVWAVPPLSLLDHYAQRDISPGVAFLPAGSMRASDSKEESAWWELLAATAQLLPAEDIPAALEEHCGATRPPGVSSWKLCGQVKPQPAEAAKPVMDLQHGAPEPSNGSAPQHAAAAGPPPGEQAAAASHGAAEAAAAGSPLSAGNLAGSTSNGSAAAAEMQEQDSAERPGAAEAGSACTPPSQQADEGPAAAESAVAEPSRASTAAGDSPSSERADGEAADGGQAHAPAAAAEAVPDIADLLYIDEDAEVEPVPTASTFEDDPMLAAEFEDAEVQEPEEETPPWPDTAWFIRRPMLVLPTLVFDSGEETAVWIGPDGDGPWMLAFEDPQDAAVMVNLIRPLREQGEVAFDVVMRQVAPRKWLQDLTAGNRVPAVLPKNTNILDDDMTLQDFTDRLQDFFFPGTAV